MAEESGRPGTSRSKVGWLAIEEPCTNRMMPLVCAGSSSHLFHRKSFTLPSLLVQCSVPESRCGEGDLATSFIGCDPCAAGRAYFALMLFALISFAHLAISASMCS